MERVAVWCLAPLGRRQTPNVVLSDSNVGESRLSLSSRRAYNAWFGVRLLATLCGLGCTDSETHEESQRSIGPAGNLTITTTSVYEGDSSAKATIGKPRAVVETPGELYVLDSDWKRVSVFSTTDGVFIRHIGNGYGAGPGQFALPVDMVIADSMIYVLEYELRRISLFTTEGQFVRDISTAAIVGRAIAVVNDTLWLRLMNAHNSHALARVNDDGTVAEYRLTLSSHDLDIFGAGAGGILAMGPASTGAVYVHGDAGTVSMLSEAPIRSHSLLTPAALVSRAADGAPLPWTVPMRAALGAAILENAWLVVLHSFLTARSLASPDSLVPQYRLSVFDTSGRWLGQAEIPLRHGDIPVSLDAAMHGAAVYLSIAGPAARVERLSIEIRQKRADYGNQ